MGGDQLGRINKNKLRSFKMALKNSYNTRTIKTPQKEAWPCLINTNKLTANYDRKILSVEFESALEAGDVFEVLDDGTKWMVYLPFLTETAYLRSEIIRCRYTVDINGHEYWVYFQGPTETSARWFVKDDTNISEMNLSGTIYVKKNEETDDFFQRFNKLKLGGKTWEIQATDRLSAPGIIEVIIKETFNDSIAELPEIKVECPIHQIMGPTVVNQDTLNGYEIRKNCVIEDGKWWVEGNPRVRLESVSDDGEFCKVRVYGGAVDSYRVYYGIPQSSYHLDVDIKGCRPAIIGDTVVSPYDIVTYKAGGEDRGSFVVQTKNAKILEQNGRSCKLEITTTKSCEFTLYFNKEDGTTESIDITVKSL